MDTNILLESGTNELEVLEFTLGNNHYGINVAKIREILTYQPVTPVPNSHPSVEGIFMPRDTMITVVNLKRCLGMAESGDGKGLFIITNFNKLNIAFHVDAVIGIHRVSWESIIKPDSTINTEDNSASTGVIKMDDKLIIILDFEKIVSDISPETGLKVSDVDNMASRERCDSPILIAEDSPLLSRLITDCLKKAGYTNLIVTMNGQEAWDKLTPEQQDILMQAGKEASEFNRQISEEAENKVLDELKADGINVIEVDDITPWQEACKDIINESTKDNAELYQQILDMK